MASDKRTTRKTPTALVEFFRETRTNDKLHTHVLLGPPYGNYSMGSRMAEMWHLYGKSLDAGHPLYVAEAPGKETPVLVDIDLKARTDSITKRLGPDDHLYDDEHVIAVVNEYQTTLKKIVQNVPPDAVTCVLLEKPWVELTINGVKYVKNGFHLHFPKLFLDKKVQEVYLIPLVKRNLANLFDELNVKEFIDANSINVHWLMYGSKKPNNEPYVATKCFVDGCLETTLESGLGDYELPSFKNESIPKLCAGNVERSLPRILSIFSYGKERYYYRPKPTINTPIMEQYAARKERRRVYDQQTIVDGLNEARKYVGLLARARADDRSDWLAVGFCLWNLCDGDDEGLSLWLDFSDSSDKYDEAECLYLWNNMRSNQYTMGTLRYFAKMDNPEAYAELFAKTTETFVSKAIGGSHFDLARLMFNEYSNEFICASPVSKIWYQFKNHIWKEIVGGVDLKERISCDHGVVMTRFNELMRDLRRAEEENVDRATDDAKKKKVEVSEERKRIGQILKVMEKCKSAPYKCSIMSECADLFRNETFGERLNKDKYLVAFQNGVYDFANDIFRAGKPEDYVSVALPIEYVDYGTVDHPAIMDIDEFFRKIFPDRDVRDYFLDQVCQLFIGGNKTKKVLFWTGSGDNGKTVTQNLFEKMLGRLAIKFSTTLITGKKTKLGSAAPELARAGDGVRWAVMDEPNFSEIINGGMLKGLTGNDSYWARDLFERGKDTREIVPMFKLNMLCNKLPVLKDVDGATWGRIRVIPFESKFVDESECPDTYEERFAKKTFPRDGDFADKAPRMIQPLAWYLINRWRSLDDRGAKSEPQKVKMATSKYRQDNDIYQRFEDANIVSKESSSVTVANLYVKFQEWFREECPGQAIPSRQLVKEWFSVAWGEPIAGKKWDGLAFVVDDERQVVVVNPMLN